jgi:hypothetical protein
VPQSIDRQTVFSLSQIMKSYGVFGLALQLQILEGCYRATQMADAENAPVKPQIVKSLGGVLSGLKSACEEFGADSSLILSIDRLARNIQDGTADQRPSSLIALTHAIITGIHDNLSKRNFMLLSEEESTFYRNPNVFGESFKTQYPARAMQDVFDAGNCYAASLYTACVFHCMRVAEYGLRKLAANRTLRIKLTRKSRPCPIEYATWQDLITAIQNKIRKIRQRPVGPKREEELQFLSSAADHCDYMKEIWRNEISRKRAKLPC